MAYELSLKLIGFSDAEAQSVESVMFLAGRRLAKPWRIVKSATADFYLLPEKLKTNLLRDARLINLPQERCIFTVQQYGGNAAQLEILTDTHSILRLQDLVALLNNLSAAADSQSAKQIFTSGVDVAAKAVQSVRSEAINPTFTPHKGFLGLLLAHRERQPLQVTIVLKNQSPPEKLYIYPDAQLFYSRNGFEQLQPWLSASDAELLLETSAGSHESMNQGNGAENFRAYPLSSLIWYTAFKTSQGRLLDGADTARVIKLSHWPDITLPGCRELMKLAAFMHSNAANLQTFADKLDLPLATVIDFYNACELIGIIEHREQADWHDKKLPAEKSILLAKIQSRLNKHIVT